MQIVYSLEEPPKLFRKSLFLAGPTPRHDDIPSWRPRALQFLEQKRYDGVVFIPENRPGSDIAPPVDGEYPAWEQKMMNMSDLIPIWMERDFKIHPKDNMPTMPALTTNVEFGLYAGSGKVLFGPPDGVNNSYFKFKSGVFHIPQFETLESMLDEALKILGDGTPRTGGEREIPLFIWRQRAFLSWYIAQTRAGNRLDGAQIEWLSRVRNKPEAVFAFAIRPNIYIASENRNKINDPVIFRLDISSVVLYRKRPNLLDTEVVIIREFRSAASTSDGFIWELPGGSSPFMLHPLDVAVEEVKEEVGLDIKPDRLRYVGTRQMAGTLSVHKSHTYGAELTEKELVWVKNQKNTPHGSDYPHNPTGEQAYTEVITLREIREKNLLDWSNLGMILQALNPR